MRQVRFLKWLLLSLFLACLPLAVASQEGYWNLKKYVTGPAPTLAVHVHSVNTATGEVEVWASESALPPPTFTFDWGDGQTDTGGCIQSHTYQDLSRNYLVRITSHYADGTTDEAENVILFVPVHVSPIPLPPSLSVTIPGQPVNLASRFPDHPPPSLNLTAFDDSFFSETPRATVEYVLTAGATVEEDLANGNLLLLDGAFRQVVLRDAPAQGAQALFDVKPIMVAAGDSIVKGSIHWSVFFHELAHNFQMSSPEEMCFGCWWVNGTGGYFCGRASRGSSR